VAGYEKRSRENFLNCHLAYDALGQLSLLGGGHHLIYSQQAGYNNVDASQLLVPAVFSVILVGSHTLPQPGWQDFLYKTACTRPIWKSATDRALSGEGG